MPEHADLVSTTDYLEAVSVFKGWKNFFFVIILICLALIQVCFWVVDTKNVVDPNSIPGPDATASWAQSASQATQAAGFVPVAVQAKVENLAPDANAKTPGAKLPSAPPRELYKILHLRF